MPRRKGKRGHNWEGTKTKRSTAPQRSNWKKQRVIKKLQDENSAYKSARSARHQSRGSDKQPEQLQFDENDVEVDEDTIMAKV